MSATYRDNVRLGSTLGLAAWLCLGPSLACNSLTGFSSLDKCEGEECAGAGGGTGTGTATGTGTGTGTGVGGGGAGGGPSSVFAINTGRHGTCLTTTEGPTFCWGQQTGNAAFPTSPFPQVVDGPGFVQVLPGFDHTCGITEGGEVYCWGGNDFGQLGDGTTIASVTPKRVEALPVVERISVAGHHTCALTPLGGNEPPQAFCWGLNSHGQLGTGDESDRFTPTEIVGLGDIIRLAAGVGYSCAVRSDGTLLCWGRNDTGQCGLDPQMVASVSTPTEIVGFPALERVYPAQHHTCGRTDGVKEMVCWGANDFGQLGDGTTTSRHTPQIVQGISNLSIGYPAARHTCAIDGNLDVFCWGANDHGQLGTMPSPTPVTLPSLVVTTADGIAAKASEHTCWALGLDLFCAGLNDSGQLGNGTYETPDAPPTQVTF